MSFTGVSFTGVTREHSVNFNDQILDFLDLSFLMAAEPPHMVSEGFLLHLHACSRHAQLSRRARPLGHGLARASSGARAAAGQAQPP